MHLYLIPGLGFDHRIFRKLDLQDYERTYLDWIEPLRGESFPAYAGRLADRVDHGQPGKKVLIGHSMGGMVSQEIARIKHIDQVILLSSIRSRHELPLHFKVVRPLGLHRLFTKKGTVRTLPWWAKRHDYERPEDRELFVDMVSLQSNRYLQWALKALSRWQTPELPAHTRVHQIHGRRDRTFPCRRIQQADHVLSGAGHFMVYKHPEKISRLIREFLTE